MKARRSRLADNNVDPLVAAVDVDDDYDDDDAAGVLDDR